MAVIPTFKEKEVPVLDLETNLQGLSEEYVQLEKVFKSISTYGTELTTSEVVALLTYEQEALFYVTDLLNEVLEANDLEYIVVLDYEYIKDRFKNEINVPEEEDPYNIIKLEIASNVLAEIGLIQEILKFIKPVGSSLEDISSEDSLLGILLEVTEDSSLTKEEIVVKLKQELKQLEEKPVVNDLKNNNLIEVHEVD